MIRTKRILSKFEVAYFYDVLKFLAVLGLSLEPCDICDIPLRHECPLIYLRDSYACFCRVIRYFTDLPLRRKFLIRIALQCPHRRD